MKSLQKRKTIIVVIKEEISDAIWFLIVIFVQCFLLKINIFKFKFFLEHVKPGTPAKNATIGPIPDRRLRARQLDSVAHLVRELLQNRRAAGSNPARDLQLHLSQPFLVRSNEFI